MSQILKEAFDNGRDSKGKRWEDYDTIVCPDGEVIDMQQLLTDQQRACAALSHLLPALGGLISKLRFVYTFRIPTQATDGYNIFINPQFTSHLDLTGKTFVLAHEIMHNLLNHLRRAQVAGHESEKSNIAADYEVNITLAKDLGLVKVDTVKKGGYLIDEKYHTWGYEKIYNDNPRSGGSSSMNNKDQSSQAQQQQQQRNQQGTPQNRPGNVRTNDDGYKGHGGQSGNQPKLDPDYIKGWNDAVNDYISGKLSIN